MKSKIYWYKFFSDFVIIYPLYAVMFSDFGMDPWRIAVLLAVWSVTAFALEVPSGVWADRYSRKNILFLGQVVRAVAFAVWALFPSFTGFLIGFVLWGVESALSSGTFEALLYDELKRVDKKGDFTMVYGSTAAISFIAILSASAVASPAILYGYPFILTVSSGAALLAGVIVVALPKAEKAESTRESDYGGTLKKGLREVFSNASVLKLLFFTSLAFAFGGALEEFYSIFAERAGLPAYGIGVFFAIITGAGGFGSLIAHRFERLSERWFYVVFILSGLSLLLSGYIFSVPTLLFLLTFAFPSSVIQTVFEGKLQHAIPSDRRATISSVKGLFVEAKALLIYFAVGFIAQAGDFRYAFIIMGVVMMGVGTSYLLFSGKKRGQGKQVQPGA